MAQYKFRINIIIIIIIISVVYQQIIERRLIGLVNENKHGEHIDF